MDTRIEDNYGFSRLPLEVIGLVLKKLDEDNPVEELKKCKFISSRLYKATQDIFRVEFGQKLCTHFDGSKLNYSSSRTFGMNIFGSYKLNFPTIKISRAEYYLMKSWLEKLISTNLQTLELKDNLLNWMEMIEVLAKFPKIFKLKYIQSSDDMIVADKIYNMYSFNDKEYFTQDFYTRIQDLIQVKPEFLPELKIFEAKVVHWNITNILSLLVRYSQCEQLEKFSIKIDLFGISKSNHNHSNYFSRSTRPEKLNEFHMNSLFHFSRLASSMKSIEIIIDDSKLPLVETNFLKKSDLIRSALRVCSNSVTQHFTKNELIKFDQLESLVLKSPLLHCDQILQNNCRLRDFFNNQRDLKNLDISLLDFDGQGEGVYSSEQEIEFLKSLVTNLHNQNIKARFGYQVGYTRGLENILQFSQNLSALKVILITEFTTWKFSDRNIPKFPHCLEMRIENYFHLNWGNYEFQSITEKFQNLEKLIIWSRNWQIGPKVFDQDFQLIISGLPHLRIIHIESSTILNDSALTGLTLEAIEARKENPSEPIGPEDRIGLPISHLKNLESLDIINEDFRLEISDITAHHAFENMPKLKFLNLYYSNITQEGFETILEKTGYKNLNFVQCTVEQVSPEFEFENENDENAVDEDADM